MERLSGKVAVVTGAASGIGLAVSRQAATENMKVVMADIEEPALDSAAKELAGAGAEVLAVPTDVSESSSMHSLRDRAVEHFGAVHLIHLNAGVSSGGYIWEVPETDWRWVLGVNLWGVINGIRAFVPVLVDQGEGHVVVTGSVAGLTSPPFLGPYNATKHAVVTMAETLVRDLALKGSAVGVSVLCPGFVNTRIGESDRNRPSWAPAEESEDRQQVRDLGRQLIAAGIDPAQVAEAVFEAVRHDRFYILTHPDMTMPMVAGRMHDILEGRTPRSMPTP